MQLRRLVWVSIITVLVGLSYQSSVQAGRTPAIGGSGGSSTVAPVGAPRSSSDNLCSAGTTQFGGSCAGNVNTGGVEVESSKEQDNDFKNNIVSVS
jgi:hypothetical protein